MWSKVFQIRLFATILRRRNIVYAPRLLMHGDVLGFMSLSVEYYHTRYLCALWRYEDTFIHVFVLSLCDVLIRFICVRLCCNQDSNFVQSLSVDTLLRCVDMLLRCVISFAWRTVLAHALLLRHFLSWARRYKSCNITPLIWLESTEHGVSLTSLLYCRDDELEHVKTMFQCQTAESQIISPNAKKAKEQARRRSEFLWRQQHNRYWTPVAARTASIFSVSSPLQSDHSFKKEVQRFERAALLQNVQRFERAALFASDGTHAVIERESQGVAWCSEVIWDSAGEVCNRAIVSISAYQGKNYAILRICWRFSVFSPFTSFCTLVVGVL